MHDCTRISVFIAQGVDISANCKSKCLPRSLIIRSSSFELSSLFSGNSNRSATSEEIGKYTRNLQHI